MQKTKKLLPYLILFLILFAIYSFSPIYEKEDNSFRNIFEGNKYWHDGLSPLMLAYFENYLQNRNFSLPKTTIIDKNYNLTIEKYADVECFENTCYSVFYSFGLKAFFELSYWLNKFFTINPLTYLLFINVIVYSFSILVVFFILNKIYKNKIFLNFILVLALGIGTSFLIYVKYLFVHNSFQALGFSLFLMSIVLFDMKKNVFRFALLLFSSLFLVIFYQDAPRILLSLSLIIWFLIFHYKNLKKIFSFIFVLTLFVVAFFSSLELINYLNLLNKASSYGATFTPITTLYSFYEKHLPVFYGLYSRGHSHVDFTPLPVFYSINTNSGNAIFLKIFPIVEYFLGPRGIFLNSPFLIFALFGFTKFSIKNLKSKLVSLLILFIIFLVYMNPNYLGGYIPRYVRHAEIITIILTIFLADYIVKLKNKIILIIFGILVSISILNVFSISVRTDWSYEKITDLISPDLIIWPWLPINQDVIILDLTKISEQENWNLTWEGLCNPPSTPPVKTTMGILLGPCSCDYLNFVERKIKIPKDLPILKLTACSMTSGNDGIIVYMEVDNKETFPLIFKPNTCSYYYLNIINYADNNFHNIKIYADKYGRCHDEFIYLKEIKLLKWNVYLKALKSYDISYDLIGERKNWILNGEGKCLPTLLSDYLFIEKCMCLYNSNATKIFSTKKHNINVTVCSRSAGLDGNIFKIFIDNKKFVSEILRPWECKSLNYSLMEGFLNITFSSDSFGNCHDEGLLVKELYIS